MRSIAERLAYSRRYAGKLNPLLFDGEDKLYPEVRTKMLEIVDEFLSYIEVDVKVLDVRLVGSNAAYNYGAESDIDIHIVTDLSEISDPEVIARLYFDASKKNFKDSYDIKIKSIDVELYVEDVKTSAMSNGIYSVSNDEWIKEPTPQLDPTDKQMEDAEAIERNFIYNIKQVKTKEELQDIIDDLYMTRKNALAAEGENAPGNIAFKSLRNKGILEDIKKVIKSSTSRELSLESIDIK